MGIGDLGCDTHDREHSWEWIARGHQRCRVCRREVIEHAVAPVVAIDTRNGTCDRAELVIQRAINCGWVTVHNFDELRANIRIALDTEVRAGGPYLDKSK